MIDMTPYTQGNCLITVPVAEFRNQVGMLEDQVNLHYHSCVGASERAHWAEMTQRVGRKLLNLHSKRATKQDWDRREKALERSTVLIAKVLFGG